MLKRPLAAIAALVFLAGVAGCSGDDESPVAKDNPDGKACIYVEDGQAAKEADLPPDRASYSGDVSVTISTSAGDVGATLDGAAAPCTVNSFTSLAAQGYYDSTPCHRLTTSPAFGVLQCGDPSGTGGGGPGYSYADELTGDEVYPAGTLAMANAGPDTNGSQFFMVYVDTQLGPQYTVFGTIDEEGIGVVASIGAAGVQDGFEDGAPVQPVTIDSVTVND